MILRSRDLIIIRGGEPKADSYPTLTSSQQLVIKNQKESKLLRPYDAQAHPVPASSDIKRLGGKAEDLQLYM
jgi:hypothetical protein